MKKGLFITFEGGEGAGKSTQVGILANRLAEMGYTVKVTREPGGTRIGEQIRTITHSVENVDLIPMTEAYLMAASRAQHVSEIIYPAICEGAIVICDRFVDSSIAYQGAGRELGEQFIVNLNAAAVNGAKPDVTMLLTVAAEEGLSRRNNSNKLDRLDLEKKVFYQRVLDSYSKLAKKYPKRYVVIDGTRTVDAVSEAIWRAILPKVKQHYAKGTRIDLKG
jgi:dTMP kinase